MKPIAADYYQFKMLKDYNKFDIKFKIQKNGEKESTIMYLDNFKFNQEGICKLTYDSKQEKLTSEDYKKVSVTWWKIAIGIVILIIICIVIKLK